MIAADAVQNMTRPGGALGQRKDRMMLQWHCGEDFDQGDAARITNAVIAHGRAEAVGGEMRPIGCFVRDGGRLVRTLTH